MSRPLRIQIPGGLYHVTSRGNRKEPIFKSDDDHYHFLRIFAKTIERFQWACYSYCLMDNHFHLLIETHLANLAQGMRYLKSTYSMSFNRVHQMVGHLFQGRYNAVMIEKQAHLLEVSRYIPLNPVRAGICAMPEEYRWSSYRATIGLEPVPAFLKIQPLLDQFGPPLAQARESFRAFVNEKEVTCPWDRIKNRLYLGSDEFIEQIHQESIDEEIPAVQRLATRPSLDMLLPTDQGLLNAYIQYGYTMKQIAQHAGVHYKTISRRIHSIEAGVRSGKGTMSECQT